MDGTFLYWDFIYFTDPASTYTINKDIQCERMISVMEI